jgi:hypothetical protein
MNKISSRITDKKENKNNGRIETLVKNMRNTRFNSNQKGIIKVNPKYFTKGKISQIDRRCKLNKRKTRLQSPGKIDTVFPTFKIEGKSDFKNFVVMNGEVGSFQVLAVLGSGSVCSIINYELIKRMRYRIHRYNGNGIEDVNNKPIKIMGQAKIPFRYKDAKGRYKILIEVLIVTNFKYDLLLGNNFFIKSGALLDYSTGQISFSPNRKADQLKKGDRNEEQFSQRDKIPRVLKKNKDGQCNKLDLNPSRCSLQVKAPKNRALKEQVKCLNRNKANIINIVRQERVELTNKEDNLLDKKVKLNNLMANHMNKLNEERKSNKNLILSFEKRKITCPIELRGIFEGKIFTLKRRLYKLEDDLQSCLSAAINHEEQEFISYLMSVNEKTSNNETSHYFRASDQLSDEDRNKWVEKEQIISVQIRDDVSNTSIEDFQPKEIGIKDNNETESEISSKVSTFTQEKQTRSGRNIKKPEKLYYSTLGETE